MAVLALVIWPHRTLERVKVGPGLVPDPENPYTVSTILENPSHQVTFHLTIDRRLAAVMNGTESPRVRTNPIARSILVLAGISPPAAVRGPMVLIQQSAIGALEDMAIETIQRISAFYEVAMSQHDGADLTEQQRMVLRRLTDRGQTDAGSLVPNWQTHRQSLGPVKRSLIAMKTRGLVTEHPDHTWSVTPRGAAALKYLISTVTGG